MLQIKLGTDDFEQILETLESDGFKVLVNKVIPQLLESRRTRLFSHNLASTDSFTQLALLRSEIDGAVRLAKDIAEVKNVLKGRDIK